MVNSFKCDICDYTTGILCNFDRHLKSNRHLKLIVTKQILVDTNKVIKNKQNICEYCDKKISNSYHINRHYKSCKMKLSKMVEQSKDGIIQRLHNQINEDKKLLKEKEENIKKLTDTIDDNKKIINKLLEIAVVTGQVNHSM